MNPLSRIFSLLLPAAIWSVALAAPENVTARRLAAELARAATMRLATDPLTINSIEAATLLTQEALALDDGNIELWQQAFNLALLSENDSLRDRAVANILRLDPAHEPARLIRLTTAIDRFQTVEQRLDAYERLLTDTNIRSIGSAVGSRMAVDAALLHQRLGNVDQFTRWLAKAIEWDSSNRAAAAIAAGFFSTNINDPAGQAELLLNLMLADPTDAGTHVELGQRLLENGAFTSGARMYRLGANALAKDGKEVLKTLVIDLALALWAGGRVDESLGVLHRRQTEMDLGYRLFVQSQQPELTLDQIKALPCPVDAELALADAVIRVSEALSKAARADATSADALAITQARESWAQRGIDALQGSIDVAREMATLPEDERQGFVYDPKQMASAYITMAWLALWTDTSVDKVESWLASAEDLQPIDPAAKERFRGWMLLRTNDADGAAAALAPLSANDVAAHLGLAHARLLQGRRADAAREFLAIVRQQPGSMIGIWSAARFKDIVGTAIPPTETAVKLESLVATLSTQFDRYVEDSSLAISLRIIPSKTTFDPFEPVTYTIELTNNSPIPLAIDRNGPLRPHLLMLCTVRSVQTTGTGDLRPFIIDLGRRLRLEPRQRLVIPIDLRENWPGAVIDSYALDGAIVRLRALLNFGLNNAGVAEPRLLGTEIEAPMIRIDGIRMGPNWIAEAAAQLASLAGEALLEHMAMMTHRVAARPAQPPPPEERDVLYNARLLLAERFARLNGLSQAWVLAVMHRGVGLAVEGLGPMHAIARKSEDRLVTISTLLFHSVGARDPVYEAAKRHQDPVVRRLAELFEADALLAEQNGSR